MDISFDHLDIQPDDVDTLIYHGGCSDGFGSALACYVYFKNTEKKIDYHPAQYGSIPPDVTGKNVLICDFSYKNAVLKEMISKANKLAVLDHHKTAQAELADISDKNKVFRMDHSGAYITWCFFHRTTPPTLIRYIEDNDIWLKKMDKTQDMTSYIYSLKMEFPEYERLLDDNFIETVAKPAGDGMMRQNNVYIEKAINHSAPKFMMINNKYYFVIHVNSSVLKSEIGNQVFKVHPNANFSAIYSINEYTTETYFSLRSTNDRTDVSEIAKTMNGGGHRCASGVTIGCMTSNLPGRVIDNYQVYNILNYIYFLDLHIETNSELGSLRAVVLNVSNYKKHLAKYLLQTRTMENDRPILECCSIHRNRCVSDSTFDLSEIYEYPQVSIMWNFDGSNARFWYTVHYLDSNIGETLYKLLDRRIENKPNYDPENRLIIFSSPVLVGSGDIFA